MTEFLNWIIGQFWREKTSLETDDNQEVDEIFEEYMNTHVQDEPLIGVITNVKPGLVEIDSRYIGKCIKEFNRGEKVSFLVHKTRNNECVTDIKPFGSIIEPVVSYVNKTGYIEKRDGASIVVKNVRYSLEGVESFFVPCVGDKVEMTVHETVINNEKSYKLVEINPQRKYFKIGCVTKWDGYEGVINEDVYFSRYCCNIASCIKLGDRVLACLIESRKNNFKNRAIYVQFSGQKYNSKQIFIEELPNLTVVMGQKKFFEVNMFNLSNKWQDILSLTIEPDNERICLKDPIDLRKIPPETCISYRFCIDPLSFERKFRVKLVWTFSRFVLGRSFYIKLLGEKTGVWDTNEVSNKVVLSAPKSSRKPNFRMLPLDSYKMPDEVENLFRQTDGYDSMYLVNQVVKIIPNIIMELSTDNYQQNLHFLLYLEELSTNVKFSELDMVTSLNRRGDDILLNLEADSPQYETLSFGDKIFAVIIWDENIVFEGDIREITPSEVVARFHPVFLKDFKSGRMYKIKFKPSRMYFRRQHQGIDFCSNILGNRLFPKFVKFSPRSNLILKSWVNSKLNEEQKKAIINVLEQKPGDIPYIIFGPPGSGKTVTLVELIFQIIRLQPFSKILVLAPSNSAVDTIAMGLIISGVIMKQQILRLGSLTYFVRGDVPVSLNEVAFFVSDSPEKFLNRDIPIIDYDSLGKHNVTLGTFSTIGLLTNLRFKRNHFSHVIIDEAGQITEPESLIPLRVLSENTGNIILCGDPMQLGAVILSQAAAILGLQRSLLSRLIERYPYLKDMERYSESSGYDPRVITKLVLNYRALPDLVAMSSSLFYNNDLKPTLSNDESYEGKLFKQIKLNFNWTEMKSLLFHHVSGEEVQLGGSTSWMNTAEAMKVVMFLVKLYSADISPDEIGIITPYRNQIKFISEYLQKINTALPKLGSVEEFQGLEKEIIILTLVRSIDTNPNSFINEPKRINVATSRAKALLLIIGNKPTLYKNAIWKNLLDLCQEVYF